MKYQVRHKTLGVFHGHLAGSDFWEHLGPVPEAGAKIYLSEKSAQEEIASMVEAYTKKDPVKYAPATFSVEPFDRDRDEKTIRDALKRRGATNLMCFVVMTSKYNPEVKKHPRLN